MPTPSEQDNAYCAAYRQWVAALAPAEQRQLAALGLDKPEVGHRAGNDVGVMEDAALRNEASDWGESAGRIEGDVAEFQAGLNDAFSQALAWTTQGKTLVEIGQRLSVVLHFWKPALLRGLEIEIIQERAAEFVRECCADVEEAVAAHVKVRDDFYADLHAQAKVGMEGIGPLLEWLSRGGSLSQWGQRVLAATYVLRPGLIEAPTLGAIGARNNKTRQAVDKLVQDFRDTFGGIKSRAMRPEENRKRCRRAQLQRISRA